MTKTASETTPARAPGTVPALVGRLPCIRLTCMANNNTGRCHGQGAATCFERRVEGQPINPPHLPDCPCGMCVEERKANNAVSGGAERRTLDGLVGSSESEGGSHV